MYAVSLRAQIKDGRIDELKEFIKNSALPTLEVPGMISIGFFNPDANTCLLYTSPSPRDVEESRMPSSA